MQINICDPGLSKIGKANLADINEKISIHYQHKYL